MKTLRNPFGGLCLAIVLVGYSSEVVLAVQDREPAECSSFKELNASGYWFWHGYFGISAESDAGTLRRGRLNDEAGTCFEVPRDSLDDIDARSRGYSEAALQWISWLEEQERFLSGEDDDFDSWERRWMEVASDRLQALTGLKPKTSSQWGAWSRENFSFLSWSPEKQVLIVERAAKRANRPVRATRLSGSEYWYRHALDQLSNLRREGDVVLGDRFVIPHGGGPFEIDVAVRDNSVTKREGLIQAVDYLISAVSRAENLSDSGRAFLEKLTHLTGQSFETPLQWVEWWRDHRELAQLHNQGHRLAVPETKTKR